jgi:hypothetical protein
VQIDATVVTWQNVSKPIKWRVPLSIDYTVRDQVLLDAITSFQDEYKELYDTWKSIDSKAQATATIAGIFLAAAFALARDVPTTFLPHQRTMLAVAIGLLVVTICLCLFGLQIRRISSAPIGENSKELIDDLLPTLTPSMQGARLSAFIKDRYDLWELTNADFKRKSSGKALWVTLGQGSLVAAIAVATTVTLLAVIN